MKYFSRNGKVFTRKRPRKLKSVDPQNRNPRKPEEHLKIAPKHPGMGRS
ncbi:MAG: hypothetical protein HN368_07245 [Spirochaetales bacterium]|nr:hypothetical protein [Spirochaetales bacterium]